MAEEKGMIVMGKLKKKFGLWRSGKVFDNAYQKLPPLFKRRIDMFRADDPDFRGSDAEKYEIAICSNAATIAEALKTVDAIDAWGQIRDHQEQKRLMPGLWKGSSGGSLGLSIAMAKIFVSGDTESILPAVTT